MITYVYTPINSAQKGRSCVRVFQFSFIPCALRQSLVSHANTDANKCNIREMPINRSPATRSIIYRYKVIGSTEDNKNKGPQA